MNLRKIITLCVSLVVIFCANAEEINKRSIDALLKQLDYVIDEGNVHLNHRIHLADSTFKAARHQQGIERINSYKKTYRLYCQLQTDSGLMALNRLASLPEAMTDQNLQDYICIGRAEMMGLMGLYGDALDIIKGIDSSRLSDDNRLFYFQTCRTVYGWLSDYAKWSDVESKYLDITNQYRDSILKHDASPVSCDIVLADRCIVNNQPHEAEKILLKHLNNPDTDLNVYIYFNLATAYQELGDDDKQIYYLTLAAIEDIKHGVTEYLALPTLAQSLYKRGDIDRAYRYMIRSMEDANFCKARLRSMEVSNIFPIIDKSYKQIESEHRQRTRVFMTILAIFSLLLIGFIAYILKQNKKLTIIRQELASTNDELRNVNLQLQDANSNLIKTDQIKEEYIALFLNRCRSYLDALEDYRHSLLKLAKNNQHDKVLRQLKDNTQVNDEQQRFYADFDKAFLDIHPQFVDNFNELLIEEERVYPKHGDQLTTEMRIFALIRLGISDSNKIAHFLNYSLATIYNYRSRITNKSIYGKDEFIARLMKC